MKPKILTVTIAGGIALLLPARSHATILGGVHDFKAQAWNSSGQICKVCHIPHNGPGATEAPLFNHTLTAASFTPYSSDSINHTPGQPVGVSKACLSCHDGTVAVNAFGGNTYAGPNVYVGDVGGASRLLGTDLSNDHPISFTFDTALQTADGALADPSSLPSTLRLFNGKVQCATCHDVHQTRGAAATPGNKLLVIPLANSQLCLTCHTK